MSKKTQRVQIDDDGTIRLDEFVVEIDRMQLQDGTNRELTPKEAVLVAGAIKAKYGPPRPRERLRILWQDIKRALALSEIKTPITFQFMSIVGAGISTLGGMLAVLPFIGHYVNVPALLKDGIEPMFNAGHVIGFGFSAWLLGLLMQFWAKASDSTQSAKKVRGLKEEEK